MPRLKESFSRQGAKSAKKHRLSFRPLRQAQGKLREKSFLDPSHSLGMTDLGPSLGALAFARVILFFCCTYREKNWRAIRRVIARKRANRFHSRIRSPYCTGCGISIS